MLMVNCSRPIQEKQDAPMKALDQQVSMGHECNNHLLGLAKNSNLKLSDIVLVPH